MENRYLRNDVKYRVVLNKTDGRYDVQYLTNLTNTWMHIKCFTTKEEGKQYLKDHIVKG